MRLGDLIIGQAFITGIAAQRRTRRSRRNPVDPTDDPVDEPSPPTATTTRTTTVSESPVETRNRAVTRTSSSNLPDFIPSTNVPNSAQQGGTGTSPIVWIALVGCLSIIFIISGALLMYQRKRIVERGFNTAVVVQ